MNLSTKEVFTRVIRPAPFTSITITYTDDGCLSITGKSRHCAGQIADELLEMPASEGRGYTEEMLSELNKVWNRWHLNDMRAGTPKQEDFVREYLKDNQYDYTNITKALEENGLLYDNGYKYGTGWLKEEVPLEVIEWLFTLPGEGDRFEDMFIREVTEADFNAILGY